MGAPYQRPRNGSTGLTSRDAAAKPAAEASFLALWNGNQADS
jgi:hypothetical protein